jgi:hypothetical protein
MRYEALGVKIVFEIWTFALKCAMLIPSSAKTPVALTNRSCSIRLQRAFTRDQRADHRHGSERQRHPRYGTGVEHQYRHGAERTQKKESSLSNVNHCLLTLLNPDEVGSIR